MTLRCEMHHEAFATQHVFEYYVHESSIIKVFLLQPVRKGTLVTVPSKDDEGNAV